MLGVKGTVKLRMTFSFVFVWTVRTRMSIEPEDSIVWLVFALGTQLSL